MTSTNSSLLHRYLDPATSMAEVLFGLIMTLTFTLGAGLIIQDEGREGARQLLIALIGCNIAWGIIDGALYLAGQLLDRGRLRRLGLSIRQAPDKAQGVRLIATELDPLLAEVLTESDTKSLYEKIADNVRSKPLGRVSITKEDWLGALVSFVLVVASSLPAALPFIFIDDAFIALRASNAILVALLFLCGHRWARFTLGKPWLVGSAFLVAGVILVLAAIALGG